MYRMLSVFLSLNFLVAFASDNNLKVKQYQSEIKLSKNERVESLESEKDAVFLERTVSRKLKSNIQKKTKGSIFDGVSQESLDAKNQATNTPQQIQSNEVKPEKVSALSPTPIIPSPFTSVGETVLVASIDIIVNIVVSVGSSSVFPSLSSPSSEISVTLCDLEVMVMLLDITPAFTSSVVMV